jgi:hypothetical protein
MHSYKVPEIVTVSIVQGNQVCSPYQAPIAGPLSLGDGGATVTHSRCGGSCG